MTDITLFLAGNLFMFLLLVWFVIINWADYKLEDSPGYAILLAAIAGVAIFGGGHFFGNIDLNSLTVFQYVSPWILVPVYIGAGVIYSIARWRYIFLPGARAAFDDADLGDSLPSRWWPGRPMKTNPAFTAFMQNGYPRTSFDNWLKANPNADNTTRAIEYAPNAKNHKTRITHWSMFWAPLLGWYLIRNPVKWAGEVMYLAVGGMLNKMSQDVFR